MFAVEERIKGATSTVTGMYLALNQWWLLPSFTGPSLTEQGLENKDPVEKCVSARTAGKAPVL